MESVVAFMSIYDMNTVSICLAFYDLENIRSSKKPTLTFELEGEYLMQNFYNSDSLDDEGTSWRAFQTIPYNSS